MTNDSSIYRFELPKPRLDRDPDAPATYRLTFEMGNVAGLWAQVFNAGAGGHGWPGSLPPPSFEDSQIEGRNLAHGQIKRYIEMLRERVDSTNREIERQRPELEARQRESDAEVRSREDELADAQRIVDELFD